MGICTWQDEKLSMSLSFPVPQEVERNGIVTNIYKQNQTLPPLGLKQSLPGHYYCKTACLYLLAVESQAKKASFIFTPNERR